MTYSILVLGAYIYTYFFVSLYLIIPNYNKLYWNPKLFNIFFPQLDTFASKVAAIQDSTADNSVGNVTGSNAVNVFLGIGIAWSIASFYHRIHGTQFFVTAGK